MALSAAIVLAELGLRFANRDAAGSAAAASARVARPYARQLAVAPGVDPAWIDVSPPPLPRAGLPPDLASLMEALERSPMLDPATVAPESRAVTRVPPSELFKVWNSRYVQESVCGGDAFFHRFPGVVQVFDPPEATPHPPYRFVPGITTPAGLVTNAFGWRGPEVAPVKPAGVVRLAFVGASTTVGSHLQPYSYPEFLAPWLNLWAARESLGVRFEVVNAGREGIASMDIAAIVRQELAAADPDFIVYYEGANQFGFRDMIDVEDAAAAPPAVLGSPPASSHSRSLLVRRLDVMARRLRPGAGSEPTKPPHRLRWPAGVNEQEPDPDSSELPLNLTQIVRDLDDIHATALRLGARLLLTSFVWMVEPGMVVDPVDQSHFHRALNLTHWPATYEEIRRMADFQNRALQAYARSRGVWFADMAAVYPRDPRLFGDAVHRTTEGDRLHAWLLFQQLVPLLREELRSGRLPDADRRATAPATAVHRIVPACTEYADLQEVDGAVTLGRLKPVVPEAEVIRTPVAVVVTPPFRTSYAAETPIAGAGDGPAVIRLRLRVTSGAVAVGVLNRDRSAWLVTRLVGMTSGPVDVFLPLRSAADASVVLVANAVTVDGERSRVELEAIHLLRAR